MKRIYDSWGNDITPVDNRPFYLWLAQRPDGESTGYDETEAMVISSRSEEDVLKLLSEQHCEELSNISKIGTSDLKCEKIVLTSHIGG